MILDEKIFEGLYYKYSDRLYNFAFRFVSDEHTAQDIVHEAYSTLWEKFEGKESDTWQALLFRIVRNRSIDTLRRQSSLRIVSLTDSFKNVCDEYLYQMDFAVNDSDRKTIYDELTANIHSIMNKLPDRCREVFMKSRFQNMKNREIAAELGISEKSWTTSQAAGIQICKVAQFISGCFSSLPAWWIDNGPQGANIMKRG